MYRSNQCEPGEWGGTFQERSRHWAFKCDMQIDCELPTRLKVMGSNVMPFVILDTQGHFSVAICQPPRNGFVLEFSPLHLRILGMFNQLEDKNHNCWFDNVYLSAKLPRPHFLTKNKFQFQGLCRRVDKGCQNVFFKKRRHRHLTFKQSAVL